MRRLCAPPGVTQEQRQAFVEEAFEEIQLDDQGIAAVLPRGPYLILAVLAAGMEMVGEAGVIPTSPTTSGARGRSRSEGSNESSRGAVWTPSAAALRQSRAEVAE